jgi:hypothetical protein
MKMVEPQSAQSARRKPRAENSSNRKVREEKQS